MKKKKNSLKEVQHFLYFYEKKEKQLLGDSLKLTTKQKKKKKKNSWNSINKNDTSLWMVSWNFFVKRVINK